MVKLVNESAAIVVLQIVDAPRGEGVGILGFVPCPSGLARAGGGIGRLVDPELQALAVNVGGQGRDPVRELAGVPLEISAPVAPVHPAVVDVDVLVSDRGHAAGNKRVSDAFDQALAGAASKGVPRVPTHGRSRGHGRRATAPGSASSARFAAAAPLATRRNRTSRTVPRLAAAATGPTGPGRPAGRLVSARPSPGLTAGPDRPACPRLAAGSSGPAGCLAPGAQMAAGGGRAAGPTGARAALARRSLSGGAAGGSRPRRIPASRPQRQFGRIGRTSIPRPVKPAEPGS